MTFGALDRLDTAVLYFIQEHIRSGWMDGFWTGVTSLANGGWFWILTAAVLFLWGRTRRAGLTAAVSMLLGFLITNLLLKNLVARPRPFDLYPVIQPLVERPHDFSFPSGHTCVSFAASLVYLRMLPRPWGAASVVLAAVIALSRLYVGVHYPSDVLGGFLVGCLVSWAAVRLAERRKTGQIVRDQ